MSSSSTCSPLYPDVIPPSIRNGRRSSSNPTLVSLTSPDTAFKALLIRGERSSYSLQLGGKYGMNVTSLPCTLYRVEGGTNGTLAARSLLNRLSSTAACS